MIVLVVLAGWPLWDAATHRPILDQAVHELLVRDVGTADTPLVGPASTDGMHHPGPLGLYVLAAAYRLLGGSSEAALVGAGLVSLLSAAAAVAIVGRIAGRTVGWVFAAATTLLLVSFGVDRVFDVWNPNLAMVPFLLFLVAVWAVTCGRFAMLPVAVLTGSFALQNHVSFVVPVVALGLWCVVGGALAARRPGARPVARWVVVAAAVGLVCWIAPLIEQVSGDPGNLTALAEYSGDERDTVGVDAAAGVVARHLGGLPTWAGAPESSAAAPGVVDPAPVWQLAVPVLALAVGAWLARRRRARELLLLQATVVLAAAAGLTMTAQITGPVFLHYTRGLWPVAMLLWVSVAWAVVEAVPEGARSTVDRWAPPVGAACVALVALVGWIGRPPHPWPAPPQEAQFVATIDATMAALPDALPGPVLVDADGTLEGTKVQTGVQLQLERAGVPVVVPESVAVYYGDHRADRVPSTTLTVATGDAASALALDPGGDVILDQAAPRVVVVLTPTP